MDKLDEIESNNSYDSEWEKKEREKKVKKIIQQNLVSEKNSKKIDTFIDLDQIKKLHKQTDLKVQRKEKIPKNRNVPD